MDGLPKHFSPVNTPSALKFADYSLDICSRSARFSELLYKFVIPIHMIIHVFVHYSQHASILSSRRQEIGKFLTKQIETFWSLCISPGRFFVFGRPKCASFLPSISTENITALLNFSQPAVPNTKCLNLQQQILHC
jgi:hypothetical protein